MKRLVVILLLLGAAGGGGYWYYRQSTKPTAPTVMTAAVTRGDIVETVGATGTLQAVTTVQVGSQVSGNIAELGADFNSLVRKGQVLARLDPSVFEAQVQQTRANLAQARANLIKAQSDLERNRVQLADAQQKHARARELAARSLLPQSDLDTAKTAVDTAQAAVQSQQATVTQVQASITQAEASVSQSELNLAHTVITSPIDGLVISRNVDVGQTVAASMQAPTLFVLAADLTKMQVVANLDESDVGRIRPRQTVTFRVDAYPADTFRGTVSQVRLEPKIQQNVVTYATVIEVPNDDLRLKPGMTANVNVEIARAVNVLRVPNGALRFRPSNEIYAALGQTPPEPQGREGFGRGRNGGRGNGSGSPAAGDNGSSPTAPAVPTGGGARSGRASGPGGDQPPSASDRAGTTGRESAPAVAGRGTPGATPGDASEANGGGRFGFGRRGGGGQGAGRGADPSAASSSQDAPPEQAGGDERRNRLAERMQNLSPEEREAMIGRMRERGLDPSSIGAGRGGFGGREGGFGGRGDGSGRGGGFGGRRDGSGRDDGFGGRGDAVARVAMSGAGPRGQGGRGGAPTSATTGRQSGATTIDALFAPLQRVISRGRAWLYVENRLRPVDLRLGISDGQNTELVEGDLLEGTELVTNVTIAGQSTRPATTAFPGFGPPGRFGGGGGGGGNRGGGGGGR